MATKTGIKTAKSLDQTYVDEVLTRQVAALSLTGIMPSDVAKQLSVSVGTVRKILASPKYKEVLTAEAEEDFAPAVAKAKAALTKLTNKAIAALERALDEGSVRDALEASKIVLKAVGLAEDNEKQGDASITVIMPGASEPKTIEVVDNELL